ncbi:MAG TPA: hypothetical protein V6D14_08525 [Coleofasciculaceae cyanobacterium]
MKCDWDGCDRSLLRQQHIFGEGKIKTDLLSASHHELLPQSGLSET